MISPRLAKPIIFAALLSLYGCAEGPESAADVFLGKLSPECHRIDRALQTFHAALENLPKSPPPESTQRIGWHSLYSTSADTIEWIDLTLDRPEVIDSVVLIPAFSGKTNGETGYGFPVRFRIELFTTGEGDTRSVIADYTREDFANPGLLPVLIPAQGKLAQKVRITATRLYQEGPRFLMALGEIMLLQKERNLGVRLESSGAPAVRASSSQGTRPDWGRINLVDGQSALGPPLGELPSPTLGYRSVPHSETHSPPNPWVTVDLGSIQNIEEVRLFPAHPPDYEHTNGFGFPVRYQIELMDDLDGEPTILPAPPTGKYNAPPGDNAVTILANGQKAQFVRLAVIEPHVSNGAVILAVAEMQVWDAHKNIALGRPIQALDSAEEGGWSSAALVDGFTSRANIANWPEWLGGLSHRREILHQMTQLDKRKRVVISELRASATWTAVICLSVGIATLIGRTLKQQQRRREEMDALRLRFAQDLHDEIGSSLGCIAFITEDAVERTADEGVRDDLREIREITQQSIESMRDLVHLAQSPQYAKGDLTEHLHQIAVRTLRSIPFTLKIEGSSAFNRLPMGQRRDVVLIFKEVLHNLSRHANATQVEIALLETKQSLSLTVRDNGCGFEVENAQTGGMGMSNLKRRAAKHQGTFEIQSTPGVGTTVTISFPRHE